ncbi:SCO1 protein [Rhodocyclaceae bacterium]|nr:SCO1 protein [Rhodocyclaceae bacterium]
MMRNLLILSLIVLLCGCGEPRLPSPFQASDVSAQYAGADFHLADHTGKPRTLADFRGKVVLLFFGYTHCPDICPATLADLAQVVRSLGQDAERVQVLFVTLDPERDTRELLTQYVPAFHPAFLGLYGDAQATREAASAFGMIYKKQDGNDSYTLDHSTGTYLIGASGKPMLLAPYGQRVEVLVQDVKLLLRMAHP